MTIARMVTCTHRGLCGETTLARHVIEIDNTSTRGHIVERLRRHNGFDRRVRREYLRMFTYFQLGQILSQIILEAFLLQSTKKNIRKKPHEADVPHGNIAVKQVAVLVEKF